MPPVSDDTDLLDWARFIFNDSVDTKRKLAEKKNIFREALDMVGTLSRDANARMLYDTKIKQERDAHAEKAFAYQQEVQQEVQAEREKLTGIIAKKDTTLAAQDAEIAAFKAKLGLQL